MSRLRNASFLLYNVSNSSVFTDKKNVTVFSKSVNSISVRVSETRILICNVSYFSENVKDGVVKF